MKTPREYKMNVMRISEHADMDGKTTKVKAYKVLQGRKVKNKWQGHIKSGQARMTDQTPSGRKRGGAGEKDGYESKKT